MTFACHDLIFHEIAIQTIPIARSSVHRLPQAVVVGSNIRSLSLAGPSLPMVTMTLNDIAFSVDPDYPRRR
jgi:hypothetical protein